jgi:thiosulfate/3-mercaptopyruvate sulfurtransferase
MNHYAHPEVLVDPQWLVDRLDDPSLRVIEVDMNPDLYKDRHIPGAVFWNVLSDLFRPNLRINFDPTAIENLLSRSGITQDTTIVAYGSYPGTGAWIFWFLKMIGHPDVRVLNGGHQKWMAEDRPVTATFSTPTPTQYLPKPLDTSLQVLSAEVQTAITNPNQDCAVGGRSAYIWFVLKYLLGYPQVRNYDGSWNEWSHLPNVAIEK